MLYSFPKDTINIAYIEGSQNSYLFEVANFKWRSNRSLVPLG